MGPPQVYVVGFFPHLLYLVHFIWSLKNLPDTIQLMNNTYILLASLFGLTSLSSADTATISVNANDVLHERPISLIGGNIEDLNAQLYGGLYSQLIYGECFEEHVDPTDLFKLEGPDRLAVWVLPDQSGQPTLKLFGGRGRLYNDDGTANDLGELQDVGNQFPEVRKAMLEELDGRVAAANAPLPFRNPTANRADPATAALVPAVLKLGRSSARGMQ